VAELWRAGFKGSPGGARAREGERRGGGRVCDECECVIRVCRGVN
jgi:hypothetical protein